jgi:hypothetical protein
MRSCHSAPTTSRILEGMRTVSAAESTGQSHEHIRMRELPDTRLRDTQAQRNHRAILALAHRLVPRLEILSEIACCRLARDAGVGEQRRRLGVGLTRVDGRALRRVNGLR